MNCHLNWNDHKYVAVKATGPSTFFVTAYVILLGQSDLQLI